MGNSHWPKDRDISLRKEIPRNVDAIQPDGAVIFLKICQTHLGERGVLTVTERRAIDNTTTHKALQKLMKIRPKPRIG